MCAESTNRHSPAQVLPIQGRLIGLSWLLGLPGLLRTPVFEQQQQQPLLGQAGHVHSIGRSSRGRDWRTVHLWCRMAMMAAMKKVLSPISEAPMTPMDLITASQKPRERCEPTIPLDVLFSAPMLDRTNRARCPGQQEEGSGGAARLRAERGLLTPTCNLHIDKMNAGEVGRWAQAQAIPSCPS